VHGAASCSPALHKGSVRHKDIAVAHLECATQRGAAFVKRDILDLHIPACGDIDLAAQLEVPEGDVWRARLHVKDSRVRRGGAQYGASGAKQHHRAGGCLAREGEWRIM